MFTLYLLQVEASQLDMQMLAKVLNENVMVEDNAHQSYGMLHLALRLTQLYFCTTVC